MSSVPSSITSLAGVHHFFQDKTGELTKICATLLDKRMARED